MLNTMLGIRARGGGSRERCPSCGAAMKGDATSRRAVRVPELRRKVLQDVNAVLPPYTPGSDRTCINCQQSLTGRAGFNSREAPLPTGSMPGVSLSR